MRRIGIFAYVTLSLIIIGGLQYRNYLTEERLLYAKLIHQVNSDANINTFFTAFIYSPEEYRRLINALEMSVEPDTFNINDFNFSNQILVISSRHSINHFTYCLKSKKDAASRLYIAIPTYNREETNTFFYYSISSEYTSVDNSKASIEMGIRYN